MHLRKDCNLEKFLAMIKACKSIVTFETPEGDVLAMKSKLCQFIFVSLKSQPKLLYGGKIYCKDPSDYDILKDFLC